jgi:hypothetical protein
MSYETFIIANLITGCLGIWAGMHLILWRLTSKDEWARKKLLQLLQHQQESQK